MSTRRQFLRLAVSTIFSCGGFGTLQAEGYPSRPITLVVPYAAGGPADTVARIISEGMRQSLGRTIVVENIAGAGGTIGVGRVARASPDGYTMVIGNWGSHVANGALYALTYDLLADFEPVSLLATEPHLIVGKSAMAPGGLRELIAELKRKSDQASGGTGGVGSPSHLAGILFQRDTATTFQLVPYRGAGPAMQDLVGGQIDIMITAASVALPHVRQGTIKAYAVAAKRRLATAPEIPTTDEAGLAGFYVSLWHGIWVPKGTPKEIVAKLNTAVRETLADPATIERLNGLALDIRSTEQQAPGALAELQRSEIEKWWPIIKAANIRAQ
jgi:tripartite-type tricarboxylate transporter receptor subunit TctC